MRVFKVLFLIGALGCVTVAAVVAALIATFVSSHIGTIIAAVFFVLFVSAIAALINEVEQRIVARRYLASTRARDSKHVQTMTIKVEADTSQATAALNELEQRAACVAAQITALNRLAILGVMGESS